MAHGSESVQRNTMFPKFSKISRYGTAEYHPLPIKGSSFRMQLRIMETTMFMSTSFQPRLSGYRKLNRRIW